MLVLIWSDLANFNVIMKINIISYILSIFCLNEAGPKTESFIAKSTWKLLGLNIVMLSHLMMMQRTELLSSKFTIITFLFCMLLSYMIHVAHFITKRFIAKGTWKCLGLRHISENMLVCVG